MDLVRVAICEDEGTDRHRLAKLIGTYLDKKNVRYCISQYADGEEFLESNEDYQIIFLDIEMPKVNGLEIAQRLYDKKWNGFIIFTTAFEEFWREGYKVQAFRFLVKPIKLGEVEEAIGQILKIRYSNRLILCKKNKKLYIELKDILYVEPASRGRGVIIHTVKNTLEDTRTMEEYSRLLATDCFFRTHRCCYVNMDYIVSYDKTNICLKTGENVWLSCKRLKKFAEAYDAYKWERGSH